MDMHTLFIQLKTFEEGWIVGIQEAGQTFQKIAVHTGHTLMLAEVVK